MSMTIAHVTAGSSTQELAAPRRRLRQLLADQNAMLRQGRQGRWRWPWTLLSTIIAIVGTQALAAAVLLTLGDLGAEHTLLDPQQPSTFLVVLLVFLPLILVPALLMRYLHKVPWRQVLAASGRFDWRQYARAAGALFLATAAVVALDYAIDPKAYRLIHRGIDFLPWLALGLGVIFVQTLAEEILFRGYLLRIWGAVLPYSLPTTSVIMGLFIALHVDNPDFKPDFWFNLISFALTQVVWCYVWFRTQSIAATAGLHWANNVMAFFILSPVPGWSPTTAMATYSDTVLLASGTHLLDPYAWITSLLGFGLTVWLLIWRRSPFYLPVARSEPRSTAGCEGQAAGTSVPTIKGFVHSADDLRSDGLCA
jgi:membrane protease YdiL (CAAX protease family)